MAFPLSPKGQGFLAVNSMRCFFFISLVFFASHLFSENILDHLDTSCSHKTSAIQGIDATFLVCLQGTEGLQKIHDELQKQGLSAFEYNKFHKISSKILCSYCSSIISPYLLTQILSHLSIYQYCLNKSLHHALILENQAYFVGNSKQLSSVITKLEEYNPDWDILFTDMDFHDPQTGKLIIPNLHYIPHNKTKINQVFSKIHCRYGSTAFVISNKGMKKVLEYFRSHWDNLPFDQILFKIPQLEIYGTNVDIITNRYSNTKENEDVFTNIKLRPFYETGQSFWISPCKLLTYDRFDAVAKCIYAKYYSEGYQTTWHVDMYKNVLEKMNHFYNTDPLKIGFPAFENAFQSLINNLHNCFNMNYPIPVNNLGLACDGSHRIGACLALKIPVRVHVIEGQNSPSMTAAVFRENHQLEEKYLDHMAHEYAKLKKNTFIVSLFPNGYDFKDKAEAILSEYGTIVHSKNIWMSPSGCMEYIRLVYNGEWWTGSYLDDFKHSRAKANLCFPPEILNIKPLRVYLYECNDTLACRKAKESIRALCQAGNESIHINDTHEQTKIIAAGVFNENSIRFMNTKKPNVHQRFAESLENLKKFIEFNHIDPELICIDTGSVLAAYGLRESDDLDILHRTPLPSTYKELNIDSHNPHLHHHSKILDEILFNPEYHFYYEGFKFISLDLVRAMKMDRGSQKDLNDVSLIDELQGIP